MSEEAAEAAPLVLHPFSYFDMVRRRWYRARYVAEFREIVERHMAFRIEGEPEVRQRSRGGHFRPYREAI